MSASFTITRLKRYLRESGLPQRHVARELGISQSTLNKILHSASPIFGDRLQEFERTCDAWLDKCEELEENLLDSIEGALKDWPRYLQRRAINLYLKHLETT